MNTTEIKTKTLCDCCGKQIEKPYCTGDYLSHKLFSLTYEAWYQGVFKIEDVCQECNKKIMMFLSDNNMLEHAQKAFSE